MNNIFSIGDSHSIYFFDSKYVNHHWVGWGGMPVTMYQLIQHGIPLYNIVERLPPGDICHINPKENDIVMFSYGSNDVQKNINKYGGNSYKEAIDYLVQNYISLIKKYSDGTYYKIKPIISCVFPIPQIINNEMNGSKDERITYTIYMNQQLKNICLKENIPFFDIYDLLHDNNILSLAVADNDMTHLDRKNIILREKIENKLKELIENHYK